jgi:cell division protein FtsZ
MGPGTSGTENNALADMVNQMAQEAKRGATALMDEEVGTLGVPNPRILIVGCGGSGNNTLNRITHLGVEGAVTVAINTDKQHLDHTRALQKLLVGRHITRGLGAGGDPSTGRRCAEAGREMIRRIVTGADLVFIASGLGGGSGTGICPIVAEEAKAAGALVVGIVTTPFHVERRQRMTKALEGLESLRRVADAVLVLTTTDCCTMCLTFLWMKHSQSWTNWLLKSSRELLRPSPYLHSSILISQMFVPLWPTVASR